MGDGGDLTIDEAHAMYPLSFKRYNLVLSLSSIVQLCLFSSSFTLSHFDCGHRLMFEWKFLCKKIQFSGSWFEIKSDIFYWISWFSSTGTFLFPLFFLKKKNSAARPTNPKP